MPAKVKHFNFPFQFDSKTGHAQEVEQDTVDDVAVCIELAFLVEPGYRLETPTFGVPSQVFEFEPLNLEAMVRAASLWENRADIVMSQVVDAADSTHLTDRVVAVLSLRELLNG